MKQLSLYHHDIQPLLIARADAARLIGVNVSKLTRLEQQGLLLARRLNPRSPKTGHCYYSTENVMALVNGTIEQWLEENAPQQLLQKKPKQIARKRTSTRGHDKEERVERATRR